MSEIAKLIKSNVWLSVSNILAKLTSALTLPILARLIGPQSLGAYNVVVSLAQTVQGFSGLGIEIALQRNGAKHQTIGSASIGRLFGVSFTLICAISAVMGLGIWYFRQSLANYWLIEPSAASWLGAAGILAGLQPLGNVPLLFLAGLQDFRAYAIRSSLGLIFSNIITIISAWKFGLQGAVYGLLISAILQIFWSYLIIKPVLILHNIRLRLDGFWQETFSILRFGLPFYLGTHLLYSIINLPLMGLVSNHSGLASLGYLRAAQSMAALAGFIPLATAPAVISHLSASANDEDQSRYLKSVHLRIVWILLLLSTTIICLFLPNLIVWLFGTNYQPVVLFAWIFLWASVLTGISAVLIQYLVADGKTIRVGLVSAIAAFFWVMPALITIPRYGVLGFLNSYVFSSIIEVILLGFVAITDFKSEDFLLLRNLAALSIILFLWSSVIFFFHFYNLATYLLSFIVIAISGLFIFTCILHAPEKIKIKEILRSKLFIF